MRRRTGWILVAGVAALALGAATVGAVALLMRGSDEPVFGGKRYLQIGLGGDLPENPAPDFGSMFGSEQLSLRAVVAGLDRAAGDESIQGVVLRVGALDTGWGRVQELRDAIGRFRDSGKPALAHLEYAGNKEYYLATACSRIYAVPTALLDVSGLAAEVTFLRHALDKLGVEAEFEGVGEYKNAPNQYTESGLTPAHREQIEALVGALFEQYVAGIAVGRGLSTEVVLGLVDRGPWDAPTALEAGLLDGLRYSDEVEEELDDAGRVGVLRYTESGGGFGLDGRPELALVYAVGEIVSGKSGDGAFGGSFAGSDTVAAALRTARQDGDVRAIVLRVDSPGGSGTASDVIWREVKLAAAEKPVIVSMGDTAASGGYYIAMNGTAIVAQPGTITGSIGVFGGKFSLRGLYEKLGITQEIVKRGERSDMFTASRLWTEAERAHFRGLMESFYEDFLRRAAEGRGKTRDEMHQVARGRVWTGAEALELGLVDQLGGLKEAIALAKEKAGIGVDDAVTLRVIPEPKTFWETLVDRSDEGVAMAGLPREFQAVARWVRALDSGPALRLPFELAVR